ncbi:MAG: hypothetical protein COV52_01710 [Gammaproteobacteria bacterium CG11_big_fil_rev_8_21_14_0_20_46_22]|nr:MAG: hypothetical protein COW05_05605 [Gammaproteobacteria bacterium CG12_big_fil_rev_8_21_14_0_65_46_12]PIR11830.1 MAG: hypothetical protein COV52_01710 [Gammaproteobacteria bacterium CG11_big_fil_rev_8_21_14_0_20_46_22]
MNTYTKQLKEQSPHMASDALQLFAGLWFWFASLFVIAPVLDAHPEWIQSGHTQATFLVQGTSQTSLKDEPRLKAQGLKFGLRS